MPKAKSKSPKSSPTNTPAPSPSSIHFIKVINLSLSTTPDCFTYFSSFNLLSSRSSLLLSTENFSNSPTPLQIGSGLLAVSSPLSLPEYLHSLNSSSPPLMLDGRPLYFIPSSLPSIPPADLKGLTEEKKEELISASFDSPSNLSVSKLLALSDFPSGISFPGLFEALSSSCSVNDLRYRPGARNAFIRLSDEKEYEKIIDEGVVVEGKKASGNYPENMRKTFSNRNKVYLSGFGNEVGEKELKEIFGKYGKVVEVKLHEKFDSMKGKNVYGFAVFENEEDTRKVIEMGSVEYEGGNIYTGVAKDSKDKRSGVRRGFGNRGGRGMRRFGGYR